MADTRSLRYLANASRLLNRVVVVVMSILAVLGLPQLQAQIPFLEHVGYAGWFVWLGLIFFVIGPYHPPALDDVTELDNRRRWIGDPSSSFSF